MYIPEDMLLPHFHKYTSFFPQRCGHYRRKWHCSCITGPSLRWQSQPLLYSALCQRRFAQQFFCSFLIIHKVISMRPYMLITISFVRLMFWLSSILMCQDSWAQVARRRFSDHRKFNLSGCRAAGADFFSVRAFWFIKLGPIFSVCPVPDAHFNFTLFFYINIIWIFFSPKVFSF